MMTKFDLPKLAQSFHVDDETKGAKAVGPMVPTDLQFVKNTVSAKCNNVKLNKMRYACIMVSDYTIEDNFHRNSIRRNRSDC